MYTGSGNREDSAAAVFIERERTTVEFYTLASGSSGNSTLICSGGTSLLVDAGISCRKLTSRLALLGNSPSELNGIFITHTHSDQICGLKVLLKNRSIPVYASEITGAELLRKVETLDESQLHILRPEEPVGVGDITVLPFPTPHDAPGSMGFHFSADGRRFAIITDLGHVPPRISEIMDGVDAAVIEANHDPDWLVNGPYPFPLQQRILGSYGHLSNEVCGDLAVQLVQSGAKLLVLGHLSAENNSPERAYQVVSGALAAAGCREVRLCVAPRDDLSEAFYV